MSGCGQGHNLQRTSEGSSGSSFSCMAAVAAGYRKGQVSTAWPALLLSCTNGRRKRSFHLVGAPFLAY